ncbi:MAG: aminoacyl-tRNA hydrolase [Alphaproteobacteria bacterium]|nr:aminoacyl-tRNA hydrolase [Alphaproteobacteria bacterium]
MPKLTISPSIALDDSELIESFVLASGPGGQNVNKLATAVELRFDVQHSPSLSDDVRTRLIRLCGRRLTKDGILVIHAQRFRSQERNRADARERLFDLILRASVPPRPRTATRPTRASRERRLEGKKQRSALKQTRARRFDD